jgi:hypothetical protein
MKFNHQSSSKSLTDNELMDLIRKGNNHLLKEGLEFALGRNKYKPLREEFFNRNKEKWKRIILAEGDGK